jgi:hypothetical protein
VNEQIQVNGMPVDIYFAKPANRIGPEWALYQMVNALAERVRELEHRLGRTVEIPRDRNEMLDLLNRA